MDFERELLNIIIERVKGIDDKPFCFTIAEALKEYAGACLLGKSANNSIEEFESSNGCVIRVISGLHSFKICPIGKVTRKCKENDSMPFSKCNETKQCC